MSIIMKIYNSADFLIQAIDTRTKYFIKPVLLVTPSWFSLKSHIWLWWHVLWSSIPVSYLHCMQLIRLQVAGGDEGGARDCRLVNTDSRRIILHHVCFIICLPWTSWPLEISVVAAPEFPPPPSVALLADPEPRGAEAVRRGDHKLLWVKGSV